MAGRLSEEEVMGQMWRGMVACPLVHEGGGWRWRKKPSSSSLMKGSRGRSRALFGQAVKTRDM